MQAQLKASIRMQKKLKMLTKGTTQKCLDKRYSFGHKTPKKNSKNRPPTALQNATAAQSLATAAKIEPNSNIGIHRNLKDIAPTATQQPNLRS